jgi:hypothetical protein
VRGGGGGWRRKMRRKIYWRLLTSIERADIIQRLSDLLKETYTLLQNLVGPLYLVPEGEGRGGGGR